MDASRVKVPEADKFQKETLNSARNPELKIRNFWFFEKCPVPGIPRQNNNLARNIEFKIFYQ